MGFFDHLLRDIRSVIDRDGGQNAIPPLDGALSPNDRLDTAVPIGEPLPGVDDVIAAALLLKPRLEALGFSPFVKTTGGKGLHVVAPLLSGARDRVTWKEAKGFAQGICQWMAQDAPERYLINMSKAKRTGKIFLDYLRNDRLSTAVAVLSPRARAGATVSMPLTWAQVRGDLDPKKYTVRSVPALLAKTKAWDGYEDAASSIKAAMKKLATR